MREALVMYDGHIVLHGYGHGGTYRQSSRDGARGDSRAAVALANDAPPAATAVQS